MGVINFPFPNMRLTGEYIFCVWIITLLFSAEQGQEGPGLVHRGSELEPISELR